MKTILREPLVHFLVAGALLFGLFTYAGGNPAPDDPSIVVGKAQIEHIQDAWSKQWRRMPTDAEMDRLIEQFIEEEVLYREALALGLEQDDTIIRRRLAQKVRFLIQDIAAQDQPDQADLKAFFEENSGQFEWPARISFTHVYLDADKRGDSVLDNAKQVLERLQASGLERAHDHGDPFMLHYDYAEISETEAARLFGGQFAESLFELTPGSWHGPIRSGYGVHLVRISEHIPARMPELAEVEDRVRQEYMTIRRREANREAIDRLKARYRIVIAQDATKRENAQSASTASSGDDS